MSIFPVPLRLIDKAIIHAVKKNHIKTNESTIKIAAPRGQAVEPRMFLGSFLYEVGLEWLAFTFVVRFCAIHLDRQIML